MKYHFIILMGILLLLGYLIVLDHRAAVTLFWPFLLTSVVLIGVLISAVWLISRKSSYLLYLPTFLLLLSILHLVQLSPVKPFRLFYQSLQPDFTQQAVYDHLHRYFPPEGRYNRPIITPLDDGSLHVALNPNDPKYDSEVVFITFQDGRIKHAEYSAD